ncbi:sigma-70 family RNA polymerase sigma factor [Celeribacter sp. SCSIO 80788]|uniref:sigma-70 family RNA polymerase sigma factor n=1 Tax=Celeribacter sp. SCSIO 80788 TaxID=3117013 RepID=UPI003DA1EC2C
MGDDATQPQTSQPRERVEALIARVSLGERAALSDLYDLTQAKLFAVSLRVLGDRHAAEDAMHDTYVKIWKNADRYKVTGHSPMTWLITIARNTAIDRLRARRSHADVGAYSETLASSAHTPEQGAMVASEAKRIVECLDTLPTERRSAITGAYLDGRNYAELAEAAKVPLNTMRTWLRRGLIALRKCMEQ